MSEKDIWWKENYESLIELVADFDYDDFMSYLDDEEVVESILDSSPKNRALELLDHLSIDELNDLLNCEDE